MPNAASASAISRRASSMDSGATNETSGTESRSRGSHDLTASVCGGTKTIFNVIGISPCGPQKMSIGHRPELAPASLGDETYEGRSMRRIMALASKYYTRAVKGAQYRMNRGVRPYASNLNTLMPRPQMTYRSGRPSSSRTMDSCVPPAWRRPAGRTTSQRFAY